DEPHRGCLADFFDVCGIDEELHELPFSRAPYEAPLTDATVRIGTVDVPAKIERERYFRELDYLELSVLFAGPVKPGTLARWDELAPEGGIGLAAPFSLTHRKPPAGTKLWPHDASTGDFRDSPISRATLAPLRETAAGLHARTTVVRSPEDFSPSAGN